MELDFSGGSGGGVFGGLGGMDVDVSGESEGRVGGGVRVSDGR